jgi:transposase
LTAEAAAGTRDLYHLDECGFAPSLPTSYTWARERSRPRVAYEAPQGRRVNVIGALAAGGPAPRFVYASRRTGKGGQGRLDSAAFLDFVCRAVAELPATWDALPADYVRPRPCTIALDNYSVHHSKAVQAAVPALAAAGVDFFFLPPYSPELSTIEPVWHHTKYTDLTTRSYADGAALHAAVDAALDHRAAALQDRTQHLSRGA